VTAGELPPVARQALEEGAKELDCPLSAAQVELFDRYAGLLRSGREEANLTALTDPFDVVIKHFLDSLAVLVALPPGAHRLIDVGAGAGFPGLPLKIARPELDVVLLEATGKKAAWLNRTRVALGLQGIVAIAERAETLAHVPEHRHAYDVATARAVAPLAVLYELCLPFVKGGGRFIALKTGTGAEVEVPRGENALRQLGGQLHGVIPVQTARLPNRVLIVIDQIRPVPLPYPRRPGMPSKRPL
jgi:16S rRNA (guanine527-N7)-methyltransferase